MIKISCVHTGAGAGIYGIMENELKQKMTVPYVISHMTDPEIISRISAQGYISRKDVAELLRMYSVCVDAGADIIVNMCSSIGEVAEAADSILDMAGVSMVRIDRRMCEQAVKGYSRIGVVATLKSTMQPSCKLVERCAKEQNKEVKVVEILADGAFGLTKEEMTQRLIAAIDLYRDQVDTIILAQNSMTECMQGIHAAIGKEVFSSPYFAAEEIAEIASLK